MIIVEGPDGSGKTTLIERLSADLKLPIHEKAVGHDGPGSLDLAKWVEQNLSSKTRDDFLYDRYPLISEPIYGPIIRGEPLLGSLDKLPALANLYRAFYEAKPLIIYCLPPVEHVRVNVALGHTADNEHLAGVLRYTDAIWGAYFYGFIRDYSLNLAVLWDYTGTNLEPRYKDLLDLLEVML